MKSQGKNLESPSGNGITELQNFFLSWANVWCGELRPEIARTAVMTQGHSLDRYRVNNVVGNMPEFAHAFGCRAGTAHGSCQRLQGLVDRNLATDFTDMHGLKQERKNP